MEKTKNQEELQSRREFFKNVAKGALPILGAIALSSVPFVSQAVEDPSSACKGACSFTCQNTCSGSCSGHCSGFCGGACSSSCSGRCQGTCTGSCSGSCGGACSWGARR